MKKKVIILGLLAVLTGCSSSEGSKIEPNEPLVTTTWVIGDPPVQEMVVVETAKTDAQKNSGLNGRDDIGKTDGMVFYASNKIIELPVNMPFAVDFITVDTKSEVKSVKRIKPDQPFDKITSDGTASFVLMLKEGTASTLKIDPGDKILQMTMIE